MRENEYHTPVLCAQAVEMLVTDPDGIYCDGTVGGGGHLRALRAVLSPKGVIVGIDRDREAIEWNRKQAERPGARIILEHETFEHFDMVLKKHSFSGCDGLLLDLGVSSHQIDDPKRGFTFMQESPLDMRMDTSTGLTAAGLLENSSEAELTRILSENGEIRNPHRMARTLKTCPVPRTSTQFRQRLDREYGQLRNKILARVFQALRIAVNGELVQLQRTLAKATEWLYPGGRLVVLAYHSLEDRIVKNFMRDLEQAGLGPWNGGVCDRQSVLKFKRITRRAIKAPQEEVIHNPRSRSARLRVLEKSKKHA